MKNNQRLTQEEFVNRVNALNKGFRVKGKYVNSKEPVEIECQFGHIWSPSPSNLMRGSGCIYCSGKKAIVGETDLWTTHPNVAAILKNPDDGHRYTQCSIEMQELYGMTFNVPNIIKACKTKKSYKNFNFRYST